MKHNLKIDNFLENNLISESILKLCKSNAFNAPVKMVEENFSTYLQQNNVLLLMWYNATDFSFYNHIKNYFPNKKLYIYQLEQLYWYNPYWFDFNTNDQHIINNSVRSHTWLADADHIWWYDIDNISFLESLWYKNIVRKPMLYTASLKRDLWYINKDIDILFYWSLNTKRIKLLHYLITSTQLNVQIIGKPFSWGIEDEWKKLLEEIEDYRIDSIYTENLRDYIDRSKIILNVHFYESAIQEQVRIFELLINNKLVLSEKSRRNYYGELIHEFDTKEEMLLIIDHLLSTNKRNDTEHLSKRFLYCSKQFLKTGLWNLITE